jgi:hypothetical protein
LNHLGILLRLFPFVLVVEHLHIILKLPTFHAFVGDPSTPSGQAIHKPVLIDRPILGSTNWNLVGKDYLLGPSKQLVRI